MRTRISAFLLAGLLAASSIAVAGADFTVTKTADTNDGVCDADCSLREAVAAAVAAPSNDNVLFGPAFFASPQTINVTTDIVITTNGTLNIIGPGPGLLTVSGSNVTRIFTNQTGAVTAIGNLRLTAGTGVSTVTTGRGGAVYNNGGNLTLRNLEISGNTAANGGAYNTAGNGTTTVDRCFIFGNSVTGAGGGLQNFSGSTTNILNSSIIGNTAGTATTGGGAIQGNGTLTITNTTIAANQAPTASGGGVYFNGTAITLNNVTIANNASSAGSGGLHVTNANPINIRNTVLAGNSTQDVNGTIVSKGKNIVQVSGASGWIGTDQIGVDPKLGPVGLFGGIGGSVPLLSTSTAINAGDNCVLNLSCTDTNPPTGIALDQRGAPRNAGGTVDIGAFEADPNFVAAYPNAKPTVQYNYIFAPQYTAFGFTSAGTLPPGISLNSTATNASLLGTPTQNGMFPFDLIGTSTTAGNPSFTQKTSVTVKPDPERLTLTGRLNGPFRSSAIITITDSWGRSESVPVSPFGFFQYTNMVLGEIYLVSVSSKLDNYAPAYVIAGGDRMITLTYSGSSSFSKE